MFFDSTVFVIVKEDRSEKIYKIEIDAATQQTINGLFDNSAAEWDGKQSVPFTGSYTPLEDEILYIQNFIN